MEDKIFRCISSGELERMVDEHFHVKEWSFITHIEGDNAYYAYHNMQPKKLNPEMQEMNLHNLYSHSVHDIIEELVSEGLLPAGNILVDGTW